MARQRFLSVTFAVQYFNQKTLNDTLISHFLPGNIQDNINTFDRNKIYFFVKLYNHERPGDIKSVLYMATSAFKNKNDELKKNVSCCHFSAKPPILLVGEKIF